MVKKVHTDIYHKHYLENGVFAAKARVSPLGSPSVMNMLAPLVRRMFGIAYGENEFM